jgi:hypothetical protein
MKKIGLIVLALFGCVSNGFDVQSNTTANDFYRNYRSTSEQIAQFKNYSIEEQYEIFEFGNQVVHPPATYLIRPYAEQGPTIVPFLRMKLESATDEATIRDITMIFAELARLRRYDFSKDTELMSLLNRKVNSMHGIWQGLTLKSLSEIK